jgi:hypothetical protein
MSVWNTDDTTQRRLRVLALSVVIAAALLMICWSAGLFRPASPRPASDNNSAAVLQRMGNGEPVESGSPNRKRNSLGGEEP